MEALSLTNPFTGVDVTSTVEAVGEMLLETAGPLVGPILAVSLSIAAIPMGIRLVKRLAARIG